MLFLDKFALLLSEVQLYKGVSVDDFMVFDVIELIRQEELGVLSWQDELYRRRGTSKEGLVIS